MASELWLQGIATMVLESPFYGARRPVGQEGSRLLRVSDLLVLGRATIEESLCLLDWSYQQGYGKLGEGRLTLYLATRAYYGRVR
jgi:hypothetical protein